MLGLLDVHWSLKSDQINSWISTYVQMIKYRFIAFRLFIMMQLWDKCYINFKKINEITFQTTFKDGKSDKYHVCLRLIGNAYAQKWKMVVKTMHMCYGLTAAMVVLSYSDA
nr:hypothetical protein [Tanacetum cinerariifolium]